MTAPVMADDIKFRVARCGVCKHVKRVRFFPWNARSEVARGWVCFPCYIVLTGSS